MISREVNYSPARLEAGAENAEEPLLSAAPTLEEEFDACIAMLRKETHKYSHSVALSCSVYLLVMAGFAAAITYSNKNLQKANQSVNEVENLWATKIYNSRSCENSYDPFMRMFFSNNLKSLNDWLTKLVTVEDVCRVNSQGFVTPNLVYLTRDDPYERGVEFARKCFQIISQYCIAASNVEIATNMDTAIRVIVISVAVLLSCAQIFWQIRQYNHKKEQAENCIYDTLSTDKLKQVNDLCEKAGIFVHRKSTIDRVLQDLIDKRERMIYIPARRHVLEQAFTDAKTRSLVLEKLPPIYTFFAKDGSSSAKDRIFLFANLLNVKEEASEKRKRLM